MTSKAMVSHSERLLEKQEARVIAAKDKLQEETREYERIRAQYAEREGTK